MRTIVTFEMGRTTPTPLIMKTLQEKLEDGGVEFTDLVEGEHQEGVRLKWERKHQKDDDTKNDTP
jgi:hypothetical protein